jgi:hypothetical protein
MASKSSTLVLLSGRLSLANLSLSHGEHRGKSVIVVVVQRWVLVVAVVGREDAERVPRVRG